MHKLKAVLFDLDNTLFDFAEWWDKSLRAAFRSYPPTASLDQEKVIQSFRHVSDQLWTLYLQKKISLSAFRQRRAEACLKQFNPDISEQDVTEFLHYFEEVSLQSLNPNENVLNMIRDLKSRFITGIVTNGTGKQQLEKMNRLGLHGVISPNAIFISEQIGHEKPALPFFQKVCSSLHIRPEEIIVVGDSWEMDIVGAIEAGMHAVWLRTKSQEPGTSHQSFAVIDRITELRNVLSHING